MKSTVPMFMVTTALELTSYLRESSRIEETTNASISISHDKAPFSQCSHEQYMSDIRKFDPIYQAKLRHEKERIDLNASFNEARLQRKLDEANNKVAELKQQLKAAKRKAKRL